MATATSDPGTRGRVTRLALAIARELTAKRLPASASRLSFQSVAALGLRLWASRLSLVSVVALLLRLAGAALLIWVGALHLHLWSEGYRHIPTVGPSFLADAIGGFALAAVLLVWPRLLAGLLGAGYLLATLAGLVISINIGLFGFRESSSASFVVESMVLEILGAAVLAAWMAVVGSQPPPWRRPQASGPGPGES